MDDATRTSLETAIASHPVCLFMKGTRQMPQCGFSAQVVGVLDQLVPEYHTVNVLADETVRDGIKELSQWPTIPQLYVRGEFLGGCDIVTEMFQSGELQKTLGDLVVPPKPPSLTISEETVVALKGFLEKPDECVRIQVSPTFEHGLTVGPKQPNDLEVAVDGLTVLVDPMSAPRAEGLSISLKHTPDGVAFKIENPNAPPELKPMAATELDRMRKAGEAHRLIDVRTEDERRTASIEGSEHLQQELLEELLDADKDTVLVFQCHHGMRSRRAAQEFVARGFRHVYNLEGGIDAWSTDVDASVPRY